jgi:hypothetical protein
MILRHSQQPRPDPVRIPTPRTPITAYAYCGDCGADAGTNCVDENLRPCSMCPGRVLASPGADRRDSQQRSSAKPYPKPTSCTVCGIAVARGGRYCRDVACQRVARKARPLAKSKACAECGTAIRTDGNYCSAKPCMAAKKAGYRTKVPQPSRAKPGPLPRCIECGTEVQRNGRYCSAPPCVIAKQAAYREHRKKEPIACVCKWCGDVTLHTSERDSCYSVQCERQRTREYKQEERARLRESARLTPPANSPA